ncbi:MAG: Trk system potassium transporter TrkA [Candidatus Marinimicrobia bacterium]|jgi:trk system potassium uptake protein TrkA|nr:Trk system potassium transporter TrkA [Candidatus Neomarinimicrobiota bacterium]MDP6835721.1 Trk system potassium transporter TrkA [Candidatus Neomarinimicrobiota bacterium]|tara:strand:+ start:23186 stop:24526 length:1341 start_codon:yes stop_codon:yes gene_type:complete
MRIVVIGAGEVGYQLAKGLSEENLDITIIDINPDKVHRAMDTLDVIALQGDGASQEVLKEARVQEADIVVAVTRIDEVNLIASQLSHELGARKIIARLRNTDYSKKDTIIHPEKFGIDKVIHPEMAATDEIIRLVMQTAATSVDDFEGGKLQLIGLRLSNGCPVIGNVLVEIRQENPDFAFNAVCVLRGNRTIVPHGDSVFEPGDIWYFLVKKERVENLLKVFGKHIKETQNVIILGGGKIGRTVARLLQDKIDVRLIDSNQKKAEKLAQELEKTLILHGDGTDIEFLRSESIEDVDSFIAVTQNEQTNLLSALLAKHLGVRQSLVHVSTTEYIPVMKVIGMDSVVSKNMSTVKEILEYIKSDEKIIVTDFEDVDVEAIEFSPQPGCKATRNILSEIKFPSDCVVGAVNHHGHISIAQGDTQLSEEDIVLVFVMPAVLPKIEKLFS